MTTRVQFDRNGDIDELHTAEVEVPETGPGQVRVQVLYAGLNPVDLTILSGGFGPAKGTRGVGMDFSGIVAEVGEGVEDFSPGQLVFGGYPNHSQAETLLIKDPEKRLDAIPKGLGTDVAGGLYIAGRTAISGIRAIAPAAGETVFVSGASGGVGIIAAQLALGLGLGARVIGTASADNLQLLRALGIDAIEYGDGLEDRLRAAAPNGIQAAYSTRGEDEIALLLGLGVPADRINSIAAGPEVAEKLGVHTSGEAVAQRGDLAWLAKAIAYGHVFVPIGGVFPLTEVQDAYRFLRAGHPIGKVLLKMAPKPFTEEQRTFLTS
ncbi:NADP-dependent oxidoreductase [Brevibacterium casei]|uniref:NADP-dependent oxidoreductase n=1 Tax=Brevibacterium ammoniilyticum TaxID=1046555 RepID=A0ABP9U367_9MICO|nr:NADP-dependent oxidoreductase [Brevibacterium casei]MCT1448269.1 NADP-dependent oxidoreductase [Brevibacterium casei]